MIANLVFAALLALLAGLLAVAFAPADWATLRTWWTRTRAARRPLDWQPGELRSIARELAAERAWALRFVPRPQQLLANQRLRAAGFGPVLAGRIRPLP